jgi:patched 1 protein/patched 2 protein
VSAESFRAIFPRHLTRLPFLCSLLPSQQAVRNESDYVWASTPGGISKSFVYGFTFMFWEQYVYTYENLYMEVGLSCATIVIFTSFFLRSLAGPLMMLVIILKIVVEVYGAMFIAGCKLNAFSLVNLCVSVTM